MKGYPDLSVLIERYFTERLLRQLNVSRQWLMPLSHHLQIQAGEAETGGRFHRCASRRPPCGGGYSDGVSGCPSADFPCQ